MLQIGKVLKSNGTEGGILIGWRDIDPEDIMPEEPVYIEFDGLPVPFFFESLTRRGQSRSIAKLSGVDSLKDAEELVGRDVLADYFEEEEDEGEDLSWMEGWTVRLGPDARGEVTGWMDIPGNPCLEVRLADNREVLVPFHEDLVKDADERRRILAMELPEGLLD